MIVDTHVHVVSDDRKNYPYVRDTPRGANVLSVSDLGQPEWPPTTAETLIEVMDRAGVDHALLVQTYFTYEYDNSYCIDSALAYPDRFQSVVVLDGMAESTPDEISDLVKNRGVRGLRLQSGRRPEFSLEKPVAAKLWECLSQLKIAVCIGDQIENYPRTHALLEKFPDVPVAFDHIWGNTVGDPPYEMLKPLFDLARYPNVYVKFSINNSFAAREGNSTPEQFFTTLIEKFGVERLLWGSNYPAHPVRFGDYESRVNVAREDLSFLSEEDRGLLMGGNALRLWPIP